MTDVSDIFPDHTRGVHVESCYAFTGTRDHTFNKQQSGMENPFGIFIRIFHHKQESNDNIGFK